MDESNMIGLHEVVQLVRQTYNNRMEDMIQAQKEMGTGHDAEVGKLMIRITVLVMIWLQIGKPDALGRKISDLWDSLGELAATDS